MKKTLYDFCMETGKEGLLTQWDREKNLPDTPKTISYGSRKQVWWVCDQGHPWQAMVQSRTARDNHCPVCAGKRVLPGFNDLASQYPHLAAQWHPTKNAPLTPDQVLTGSHRKVWWQCSLGHQWSTVVKARVGGTACPVCANRRIKAGENDLAAQFPRLAAQWDREKNGPLTPDQVLPGTRRKVWWVCSRGHSWQASVAARTGSHTGCPVCDGKQVIPGENDLASLRPDLAAQWHPTKNLPLTPKDVTENSNRSVWWQCSLGHEWSTVVKARVGGNGCPVCANRRVKTGENDLASRYPHLVDQWDREKNGSLTPDQILPGTRRKVWWVCGQGHSWQASVAARTGRYTGCPVCDGKQIIPGENDLASLRPDLAAQWHPTKNLPLTPKDVTENSNRSVWWQCSLGHAWRSPVGRRAQGNTGCPVCVGKQVEPGFNDLATVDPAIAAQWAQDLNGSLTPEMVTGGSARKVWWRCDQDHVWKANIYARTGAQRTGCPICAGLYKKKRYRNILEVPPRR